MTAPNENTQNRDNTAVVNCANVIPSEELDALVAESITEEIQTLLTSKDIISRCFKIVNRHPGRVQPKLLVLLLSARLSPLLHLPDSLFKMADELNADKVKGSVIVNTIYSYIPEKYRNQYKTLKQFSGFFSSIAASDVVKRQLKYNSALITRHTDDRAGDILRGTMEYLLDPRDVGWLSQMDVERSNTEPDTEVLIERVQEYFEDKEYRDAASYQLVILAECIAFFKRFARNVWRVEREDVREAWGLIEYFEQCPAVVSGTHKEILSAIDSYTSDGTLPNQKRVIERCGLSKKTVVKALKKNTGKLIRRGWASYTVGKAHGEVLYRLTEKGKLALSDTSYIQIGDATYTPLPLL